MFAKHGFSAFIDQLGILKYLRIKKKSIGIFNEQEMKLTVGERLRLALEELGPTFVKMGQIISTRPDLLPRSVISELEKLQSEVPPFSFEEVRKIVLDEFNDTIENIYLEFSPTPLAAASMAQVHAARLHTGESVVVKVQRPGIEKSIGHDLKILEDLAYFLDNRTRYGKFYDFSGMVKAFEQTIRNELDSRTEGENIDQFRKNIARDKGVEAPKVYWLFTTSRIITMEYIQGLKLSDPLLLDEAGIDRQIVARNLAASILNQILRDGFFHADPHPGNIIFLPDNTIVFLDLGMVGKLSDLRKQQFLKMLIGISFKNSKMIIQALTDLDTLSEPINMKKFEKELDVVREKYLKMPLSEIKIGEIFNEIFYLTNTYNIKIPGEFTMLAKVVVTLEGLVEKLDPELNILEIAQPIAKQHIFDVYSPERFKKDILEGLMDYGNLVKEFPSFVLGLLKKMEGDAFTVQYKLKDVDNLDRRVSRVANRVTLSIILLAISILTTGIALGLGGNIQANAQLYAIFVLSFRAGLAMALFIIAVLVISIFRSGRF